MGTEEQFIKAEALFKQIFQTIPNRLIVMMEWEICTWQKGIKQKQLRVSKKHCLLKQFLKQKKSSTFY
jgi:hypothetical protein